jgi:hypothetical protein
MRGTSIQQQQSNDERNHIHKIQIFIGRAVCFKTKDSQLYYDVIKIFIINRLN